MRSASLAEARGQVVARGEVRELGDGAVELKLDQETIDKLEEPYIPHAISGHA